jgi:hypothetical protein
VPFKLVAAQSLATEWIVERLLSRQRANRHRIRAALCRLWRGPMPHGVEVIFAVIRRRNRKRSDGADAVVRDSEDKR